MRITIECYGASARWCGGESVTLELPAGATGNDALDVLAALYPDFAVRRESVAIASGNSITSPAILLSENAHIALIPPVSAG